MEDPNLVNIAATSKRPRPSTPQPSSKPVSLVVDAATATSFPGRRDAVRAAALRSGDLVQRNTELNELLKFSAVYDSNSFMQSDAIVQSLCDVVIYDVLQWTTESVMNERDHIVFRASDAWKRPPTERMIDWAKHCSSLSLTEEQFRTCEVVAMILRNFSFAGANLRLLAYSPDLIQALVAFLYIGVNDDRYRQNAVSGLEPTISLSALQTLRNLVSYLDVTGQQLLTDKLFYDGRTMGGGEGPPVPNAKDFGKCVYGEWSGFGACWLAKRLDIREDTIENVPTELLLELTSDYLTAVWSIFPALKEVIVNRHSPRSVVLMSLDFLQDLISVARIGLVGAVLEEDVDIRPGQDYRMPNLRSVLVSLPDSILDCLISLLCVPRVGPDSNSGKSFGYNATIDFESRDRALDVLVPLLELDSPRMAARLGGKTAPDGQRSIRIGLFDSVYPILTTNIGRSDASVLATQLLRELSRAADDSKEGFLYIQGRLVELASRDARVSQLVWSDLYPIPPESLESNDDMLVDDNTRNNGLSEG